MWRACDAVRRRAWTYDGANDSSQWCDNDIAENVLDGIPTEESILDFPSNGVVEDSACAVQRVHIAEVRCCDRIC
jgi:hypothetical protein